MKICLLPLAAGLLLAACESTVTPAGFKHRSFLKDVAWEREADGTERYVSKASEPATTALIGEAGQTARAGIDASVTKGFISAAKDIQLVKEKSAGEALVKGTKDPNIIPKDPNVIPADPNLP